MWRAKTDGCALCAAGAYTHAKFLDDLPLKPLMNNVTIHTSGFVKANTANVTGVWLLLAATAPVQSALSGPLSADCHGAVLLLLHSCHVTWMQHCQ